MRGSALLMVLWLTAALSAIAFAVASNVRGETERTSTDVEGLRAYYLATGAVERAISWVDWGPGHRNPDGTPVFFNPPMPFIHYQFPAGVADVELIPESAKLNINSAPPDQLARLLAALAVTPDRAGMIVQGILDWRAPTPGGAFTDFDQYYLSLTPSFRSRHASFEEIEELLLVRGVTPELFYGGYDKGPDGNLLPRPGLKDCLSVYGGSAVYDINTVAAPVMVAAGLAPQTAALIVAMRQQKPFLKQEEINAVPEIGAAGGHIGLGASQYLTIRATAAARLPNGRLSDVKRSVAALIMYFGQQYTPSFHILRWYDNAVRLQ